MLKKAWVKRPGKRDLKKEAFWRRVLGEQGRSGLSIRAWCVRQGVRESSFFWWRRELVKREALRAALAPVRVTSDSSGHPAPPIGRFLPVHVTSDSLANPVHEGFPENESRGWIEVHWPDQRRVQVIGSVHREVLIEVFAAMASSRVPTAMASSALAPEASAC
jgi:hypothetical protein